MQNKKEENKYPNVYIEIEAILKRSKFCECMKCKTILFSIKM